MDEGSDGRTGLALVVLIALIAVVAWFFFQRSGAGEAAASAIDETVDVFVPDARELERRMSPIDEARRLTETINARQPRAPGTGSR